MHIPQWIARWTPSWSSWGFQWSKMELHDAKNYRNKMSTNFKQTSGLKKLGSGYWKIFQLTFLVPKHWFRYLILKININWSIEGKILVGKLEIQANFKVSFLWRNARMTGKDHFQAFKSEIRNCIFWTKWATDGSPLQNGMHQPSESLPWAWAGLYCTQSVVRWNFRKALKWPVSIYGI